MKRLLTIFAMMLICIIASAQIGDVREGTPMQTLGSAREGLCKLKCQDQLYFLSIKSTNQFDDLAPIFLGIGQDSARRTMHDLIDLISRMKKKATASFTTIDGKYKYTIYKYARGYVMFVDLPNIVGEVSLSEDDLWRLVEKLK